MIEESQEHYKILYHRMVQSTRDVLRLSQLVEETQEAHKKFAQNLEEIAFKFHEQISGDGETQQGESSDNDGLLFSYQHLSNYLLKLSSSHESLSQNVCTEIVEPLKMFIENFRQTNRETSASAKEWLNGLEKRREKLSTIQRCFWNARKTAEDYSETIEKTAELIERGQKKQDDLQRVTHHSVELKFEAEEAQEEYRNTVSTVNLHWEQFAQEFPNLFSKFEYNEESRIAFSRQTINKLVQYLQSQSQAGLTSSLSYQQRFNELESQFAANSSQKPPLWNIISHNTNVRFVERLKMHQERFISYDAWRKLNTNDHHVANSNISNSSSEAPLSIEDQTRIDALLTNILDDSKPSFKKTSNTSGNSANNRKSLQAVYEASLAEEDQQGRKSNKNVEKMQDAETNQSTDSQQGNRDSLSSNSSSQQQPQWSPRKRELSMEVEGPEYVTQVLQGYVGCDYFVGKLSQAIGQKGKFYLELSEEKFLEVAAAMRQVLSLIGKQQLAGNNSTKQASLNAGNSASSPGERINNIEAEMFLNVLQISTKISKRQKDGTAHRELLSHCLNSSDVFLNKSKYEELFDYLKTKKLDEKKRKLELLQTGETTAGLVSVKNIQKGIKLLGAGLGKLGGLGRLGGFFQGQKKTEKSDEESAIESEMSYLALAELNQYLLNLELPSQFAADLILDLARKKKAQLDLVPKLLEKQENKKNSEIRRNFHSYRNKAKIQQEKMNAIAQDKNALLIFIVKSALKFLSTQDKPWNLLLVCKSFQQNLSRQLYKTYLFSDAENQFLQTHRIKIWLKVLNTAALDLNYIEMKSDAAMNAKQDHIEEIITLDVNRSLHLHSERIQPTQLQSLLRVFANNNPKISYCQGMNYIAGYLYLCIQDECESYKAFHRIMNKYFNVLLTDNFEYLKVVFYQLERLLSIFLPELSEHLKQEGVDANYYATSWFITIFSSVFQYTLDSYLLTVIWDIFICEGWKGFFKSVLWVLRFLSPKLLALDFDEILHTMSDLIRVDIFMNSKESLVEKKIIVNVDHLKSEIAAFKITNTLLSNLEGEYKCFQLNLKKKLQGLA